MKCSSERFTPALVRKRAREVVRDREHVKHRRVRVSVFIKVPLLLPVPCCFFGDMKTAGD
jgi:hypothetical protein